jgi:hypothetical protein
MCDGPIPDLLGELTDEPNGINLGTRATDCYYCGVPLLCAELGSVVVGPSQPPPARRTARKRDIKFGDPSGLDSWLAGVEQALEAEANNTYRDPNLPTVRRTTMVNKFGGRAFEGYAWA